MSYQVTINSITSGTSPYNIWICDTCFGTCVYHDTITTTPYSFTLPSVYETYPSYVIKIIDDVGCVYCETSSASYKQFEDGDYFEFQDGDEYQFQ
jgi:hypothetical protein